MQEMRRHWLRTEIQVNRSENPAPKHSSRSGAGAGTTATAVTAAVKGCVRIRLQFKPPRGQYAPPGIYLVTAKLPERDGEFEFDTGGQNWLAFGLPDLISERCENFQSSVQYSDVSPGITRDLIQ